MTKKEPKVRLYSLSALCSPRLLLLLARNTVTKRAQPPQLPFCVTILRQGKLGQEPEQKQRAAMEESCFLTCSASLPVQPRPTCLGMVGPTVGQALPR